MVKYSVGLLLLLEAVQFNQADSVSDICEAQSRCTLDGPHFDFDIKMAEGEKHVVDIFSTQNWEDCAYACRNAPACQLFSWTNERFSGWENKCHLKTRSSVELTNGQIYFRKENVVSGETIKGGTAPTPTNTTGKCAGVTKYDYSEVLELSNLFYQAQRAGKLNALGDFNFEKIPYRGDSALKDGADNGVDLTGGYYDAGDQVKFNFPLASATTLLAWGALDFKQGYQASGQWEQTLNTIRWATDYFIKCHTGPNELWAQVGDGDLDHSEWTRLEDKTVARPSFKIDAQHPGSDLAGETAAALAAASLLFAEADAGYSAQLLEHAGQLFEFADTYRGKYSDSLPKVDKFYKSWSGFTDELVWAAAWLYKATKSPRYLDKAAQLYEDKGVQEFSWDDKTIGAQVLLAQLTGQQRYISRALDFCNKMADTQPRTPKGLLWIQPWGALRHAANIALVCLQTALIQDPGVRADSYRGMALHQINYALGDSGRSFVVGFGVNPPVRPHHVTSSCPVDRQVKCSWEDFSRSEANPSTLWGALVGGPGQQDDYEDKREDYVKNEVACDYNAGFQSAVAGLRTLAAQGKLPGALGTTC